MAHFIEFDRFRLPCTLPVAIFNFQNFVEQPRTTSESLNRKRKTLWQIRCVPQKGNK